MPHKLSPEDNEIEIYKKIMVFTPLKIAIIQLILVLILYFWGLLSHIWENLTISCLKNY